jgi:rare lipoprotein A
VFAGLGKRQSTDLLTQRNSAVLLYTRVPIRINGWGEGEYERNSAFTMFPALPFSCLSDAPILSRLSRGGIGRLAVVFPKRRMRAFARVGVDAADIVKGIDKGNSTRMQRADSVWWRRARLGTVLLGCCVLANCSSRLAGTVDPRYGVSTSPRVVEYGQPVPKGGGVYKLGPPYTVAGRVYVPEQNVHYRSEGVASWYGMDFHGRLTANGEVYDIDGISAAHPTLPMPCYARVTNLANQKSLIVRVNDRGPYAGDREIDVSGKAAALLGFRGTGLTRVRVEYVGLAPLEGSDDRMLEATLRQGLPAPTPAGVMLASAHASVPLPSRTVPIPEERPFDFGEDAASAVSNRGLSDEASAHHSSAMMFVRPSGGEPPGGPTTSAFAPVGEAGGVGGTSGRGLY